MIKSIAISQVATFGEPAEVLDELSQFNYVYGPNGSGKTTLSRLIATPEEQRFSGCEVAWASTPLQVLVYNRDFISRNFNQSSEIRGIFTLGEQHTDTSKRIDDKKSEISSIDDDIAQREGTLRAKKGDLIALEEQITEMIWTRKKAHETRFSGPFRGSVKSKEQFKAKVLEERASNTATLLTLEELGEAASTLFDTDPKEEQTVKSLDGAALLAHESNAVLHKRVIGKEDVDVAAMIKKLGNSDWVREGKAFYDANSRVCPFCQQKTTEEFANSLSEYFDETFMADSTAIDKLLSDYATDADRLRQELATIIAAPSQYLNIERLKAEQSLLNSRVVINQQRIVQKKKGTKPDCSS